MADLDTSGYVEPPYSGPTCAPVVYWSDLDPFTQGYVEALFIDLDQGKYVDRTATILPPTPESFSDLAPETLARIITDCAERLNRIPHPEDMRDPRLSGCRFWVDRQLAHYQAGLKVNYPPPLTVQLGDDGKVRFA